MIYKHELLGMLIREKIIRPNTKSPSVEVITQLCDKNCFDHDFFKTKPFGGLFTEFTLIDQDIHKTIIDYISSLVVNKHVYISDEMIKNIIVFLLGNEMTKVQQSNLTEKKEKEVNEINVLNQQENIYKINFNTNNMKFLKTLLSCNDQMTFVSQFIQINKLGEFTENDEIIFKCIIPYLEDKYKVTMSSSWVSLGILESIKDTNDLVYDRNEQYNRLKYMIKSFYESKSHEILFKLHDPDDYIEKLILINKKNSNNVLNLDIEYIKQSDSSCQKILIISKIIPTIVR